MTVLFTISALWITHPILQGIVAGTMYWKGLHRGFPVFFRYLILQILIFAIVFPLYLRANNILFFYVYAVSIGISAAYGFRVIYEVFLDVFRPYHALKDLGSVLFMWAGLVMLLVAGVVAAATSSSQESPLWQAVLTGQRCVRVVQVGLILFLLIFSKFLGVSRRQHSFGIALGFGGFASVELMLVALRAGSQVSENFANIANLVAYNCAILVWLAYVVARSSARESSATLLMSQRWDQSLGDLQHPVAPDSLIPMFEGMVDRALSRTKGESVPVAERPDQLVSHRMSSRSARDPVLLPPRLSSDL